MSRIIIRNESSQSDYEAIKSVLDVMSEGRVSGDGTCYCYVSVFPSRELAVAAYLTRTGNDAFYISDRKEKS